MVRLSVGERRLLQFAASLTRRTVAGLLREFGMNEARRIVRARLNLGEETIPESAPTLDHQTDFSI
jgi:hypothetical protein